MDLCSRVPAPASSRPLCAYEIPSRLGGRSSHLAAEWRIRKNAVLTTTISRRRMRSRCSYASGSKYSEPIDVVAKVVVLGGSGFVGSSVCKAAIAQGIDVTSLSRSGKPSYPDPWVDQVLWVSGNVFYADWNSLLKGATAVISTIGGFGTNEEMEKINGEANIVAVGEACKAGIPKFVYVSVHDYNLPFFVLNSLGYFTGKRKAEAEVLSKFPGSGTVLRPGFIYGKRRINGVDVPLDIIGKPLDKFLTSAENFISPLKSIPGSDVLLSAPVSVEDVAGAAVKAVLDDSIFGVLTIEQIKEAASSLKSAVPL
ncbi:uncharacterized protein At1g32220, chloroplastic isoform X2 [Selaginella moellendorffii]|nr:uncharacterized protein At1g32220, chloroplastic isoform X2 [Selaginella moellendorffii]|eukprot:XP_002978610.2 uncharacterized protein At1g32220, chloroplastic isoform X2 [Selaginella moellendorffii]